MHSFDAYTLKARVAPVFVVLIPVIASVTAWAPEALALKLGMAAIVFSVGLSMLVAQVGRDFGKRKEPRLWKSWDGPPTTQFLRHRNLKFNSILRKRYHSCLRKLRPDLKLPTPEQEARDPDAADEIYGAATRYLIGATRDAKRFPLILKENINYGFRRNLWGLKPFGIAISSIGILACIARLSPLYGNSQSFSMETVGGLAISLVFLCVWLFWVTPSMVRVAAEAYAERLLEACETLQ